ncbi:MAG: sulfatase family protein [Kiritimatiellia bacterium]
MTEKLNLVLIFADQWRYQATGYAGDPNVATPNLDAFAAQSLNFANAVSGCPVCSPYRASLMTGVYPHRHHVMVNDQCLYHRYKGPFLAECLRDAGYRTAYIGKWHLDGNGRNAFVPPQRRLGFGWWKGFECCHNYWSSYYYFGNDPRPYRWKGYDVDAQTDEACRYLREEGEKGPFALFLSWGPPHNPYDTAPSRFRAMYDPDRIQLPPNVPEAYADQARRDLAGYYAHCSALDAAFGRLLEAIADTGRDKDTILVFTSDHGDMLGSQGLFRKQKPWAESLRVPFLLRHPARRTPVRYDTLIDAPDLMPTLLALCGVRAPQGLQGRDFSRTVLKGAPSEIEDALLALYVPFHEWRYDNGGREYRGLYTLRYTYVRTFEGPWLLYDNMEDPWQLRNLVSDSAYAALVAELDNRLTARLREVGDSFAAGSEIIREENYAINEAGDIDIMPSELPEPHSE